MYALVYLLYQVLAFLTVVARGEVKDFQKTAIK